MAIVIDGKKIAHKLILKIKEKIKSRILSGKRIPGLAVILIGNNPSSMIYIKNKQNACNKVGFFSHTWHFSIHVTEIEILNLINKLNNNKKVDGILLQLPIPKNLNYNKIIETISPTKDVDGFHPYNIGSLCKKNPKLRTCTPLGIITLLKEYKINLKGLNAVIIGASNVVGRPMSMELLMSGCTTTITHRLTKNLIQHVKNAELLIVAIGQPNFICGSWIKKNAIVIDVGINKLKNGKITGDVDFKSAFLNASYITPVPGGVGPMTVVTLLNNTLTACEKYHS